jgi:4-hydroxymandelate oxidase
VRQFRCVPPDSVAHLADAARTELAADRDETTLVLSQSLAGLWTAPPARRVRVMPPGQPVTGLWCGLIDELTAEGTGLLLIADYDPGLRYLCLACVEVCPR